jgi:hypothetical protein
MEHCLARLASNLTAAISDVEELNSAATGFVKQKKKNLFNDQMNLWVMLNFL